MYFSAPPSESRYQTYRIYMALHQERINKNRVSNNKQIKETILKVLSKLKPEVTLKLVNSMKRRLNAIINSQGGPTNY